MINFQVLKRKAASRRVLELSCTQTNRQTDKQTTIFTFADPLASLIAQPKKKVASDNLFFLMGTSYRVGARNSAKQDCNPIKYCRNPINTQLRNKCPYKIKQLRAV